MCGCEKLRSSRTIKPFAVIIASAPSNLGLLSFVFLLEVKGGWVSESDDCNEVFNGPQTSVSFSCSATEENRIAAAETIARKNQRAHFQNALVFRKCLTLNKLLHKGI